VVNNQQTTLLVKNTLTQLLGKKNVIEATRPSLGGEDFAYVAKEVPATFYYVGIAKKGQPVYCSQAHNPNFYVDDEK
jgi:amidohydrolase